MENDFEAWSVILFVALVTFFNRIAGPIMMNRLESSAKVEQFLDAMSVSVVAALVASIVAQGGLREAAAVSISALVMMRTDSAFWAITAGIFTAAAWVFLTS